MFILSRASDVVDMLEHLTGNPEYCEFLEVLSNEHFSGYITYDPHLLASYKVSGTKISHSWKVKINGLMINIPEVATDRDIQQLRTSLSLHDEKDRQLL